MTAPRGGLRARAALAAGGGALAAALIAGLLLAPRLPPEARGGLAGSLAAAGLAGAALGAGAAALVMRREAHALHRLARDVTSLTALDEPEISVRAHGPETRALALAAAEAADTLRAELRALQHDHARLETVLASMTDGVVIVEADDSVSLVNRAAAELLGVEARAEGHATLADALRDVDLVDVIRQPAAAGRAVDRLISIGVAEREVHAVIAPLGGERRRQRLVLLRDLTALRRVDVVRRDFVANVSHELRTPLTTLRAMVETLQDGAAEDAAARGEFLRRIGVETERMSQIVSELLDLARVESGAAALRLATVDLNQLVAPAVERLRPQAVRGDVALAVATAREPLPVRADADRTGRVVTNLVHNAIKFTPPAGAVTVSTARANGEALLRVADSGVGLEQRELDRVFERFYKADRSPGNTGAGLGLAIARHTVRQHGGRIWAESPGPRRGATFTVALPLGAAPDTA